MQARHPRHDKDVGRDRVHQLRGRPHPGMQVMDERRDIGCAGLADVAAELALGALTGHERADALAHLDQCRACREKVRRLMTTSGALLDLLPASDPPAGFETRVLERLALPAFGRTMMRPVSRVRRLVPVCRWRLRRR